VEEGARKEESVSEQRLQKYRPGDEIDVVVHIQHAPMHLREVSARFFSEGQEGGIISHIDLSGTPSTSGTNPPSYKLPCKARSGSQRRSPLMAPLASTGSTG
jgi:hypothetical protein